jgi:hypothetical protein
MLIRFLPRSQNQAVNHKNFYSKTLIKRLVYPIEGPTTEHLFKVLESTSAVTPRWCGEKCESRDDTGLRGVESAELIVLYGQIATPEIGSFKYFIPKDAPRDIEVTPDGTRLINCQYNAILPDSHASC